MRSLSIALVLLAGCVSSMAETGALGGVQPPASAIAVEQAMLRLADKPLWPGFEPRKTPLAIHDGQQTWLFRHPAPPAGFSDVPGSPDTKVMPGRLDAIIANSSTEIASVGTATLLLDPSAKRSADDWASTAIHEAFHVFQRARHPGWSGNEADLFVYPVESDALLSLRRLETRALARALASTDQDATACWSRQALTLRERRYADMDAAFAAYERGTELNEGLASYVQLRAGGRNAFELPERDFPPAQVRQRSYATGTALALLLDRLAPAWPAAFEANDKQTLDGTLSVALGAGRTCAFDDAETAREAERARADLAALQEQRKRQAADFDALPGWRVVVLAGDAQPLWPQGFDPLNVERLGATRVLHTRFVKLGNDAGQVETLGRQALSDGIGPHPLFQGVRRVEIAGLARPAVRTNDDAIEIEAEGVSLKFRKARVETAGQTITVQL